MLTGRAVYCSISVRYNLCHNHHLVRTQCCCAVCVLRSQRVLASTCLHMFNKVRSARRASVTIPLTILGGIIGKNARSEFRAPCRTTKCALPLMCGPAWLYYENTCAVATHGWPPLLGTWQVPSGGARPALVPQRLAPDAGRWYVAFACFPSPCALRAAGVLARCVAAKPDRGRCAQASCPSAPST